jgi:hypothetical protein
MGAPTVTTVRSRIDAIPTGGNTPFADERAARLNFSTNPMSVTQS